MEIKFDKKALESFINQSVNEVWDTNVQNNSYMQLALELQKIGVQLDSDQLSQLKIVFNHIGMMSTKQSLIAILHLLDKLGIVKYGD